jgi:hypothetical protein
MTTPPLGDAAGWRALGDAVAARVGEQDPLAVLEESGARLAALLAGRAAAEMQRLEAPGRWSVTAVLEHLADAELVFAYRLRQVLTLDAPRLESFDQDRWAERGRYVDGDAHDALAVFVALRRRNLGLWRTLTDADWARVGVHGDRGPETLRSLVRIIAGHDLAHVAQVARILGDGTVADAG